MTDVARVDLLFDFYGMLLTENQQKCLEMYYSHDMSFAEIADELGVTRQGAYDSIRRGRNQLEEYEEKLGLAARFRETKERLDAVCVMLSSLTEAEGFSEAAENAVREIRTEVEKIADGL